MAWKKAGISAKALREDRILAEVRATGGDPRRLADLFGLSIEGACRYVDTFEHPDLIDGITVESTETFHDG
ncbi:MAG: hypothetical protein CMH34_09065 [Microbacterium sp.]|nr:hypothetical protein [Microbacterium sp.]